MTTHAQTVRRHAVTTMLVAAIALTSVNLTAPASAEAAPKRARTITRKAVITRGAKWVKRRVPYSQSRYKNGYRTDCSGFVSMAWQTGTSYTTRSMGSVAKRVSVKSVRPGDAVLRPGHIVLFVKWKNKRARTFVAYEQPGSGKTARKRIIKMTSGSKVLRRKGIKETPKPKRRPKPRPRPPVVTPLTPPLDLVPRSGDAADTATPVDSTPVDTSTARAAVVDFAAVAAH